MIETEGVAETQSCHGGTLTYEPALLWAHRLWALRFNGTQQACVWFKYIPTAARKHWYI